MLDKVVARIQLASSSVADVLRHLDADEIVINMKAGYRIARLRVGSYRVTPMGNEHFTPSTTDKKGVINFLNARGD